MVKLDTGAEKQAILLRRALDMLALALVEHDHVWTPEERRVYEQATAERK